MASIDDFPAMGRIVCVEDDAVIFNPLGTRYELRLLTAGRYAGSTGERINGRIRVQARKVYTVPSGGNFVAPISGPPRIVQGRVKSLEGKTIVVQAGTPIIVEMPTAETAYELASGPLTVGAMVNVTALPGARFEAVGTTVTA